MASTLAFLRPSAPPAPLAASRGAAAAAAAVRVPCRSRFSAAVSLGSEVAVGSDALFADYKPTTAFLFPGQGAQTVGMGAEALNVPSAAKLFNKANDILGYDLLDLCTNGPKEKLDSTVISQPAIYVTSLAAVEVLRAREGGQDVIDSVDVTCGLSLGEYTALAFAGAFSFEDGLKLVKLRGEAMQDASDAASSAMVSVIGLDSEKVQQLCDAANEDVDEKERVQIANFLCPGNYAVSGGVKGIEAVEAKAKSFKARMTVTSPVQWENTVKTLMGKGLEKSYELGPGKVIAGILKRINKGASIENIGA
uniref:Malonyl-CoA:ACP transacylase (MAT) domain-containing protein n=1 Tax=Leersia perrieri TaxID=77586 RepID=A0A0D9VT05_9ORYZ